MTNNKRANPRSCSSASIAKTMRRLKTGAGRQVAVVVVVGVLLPRYACTDNVGNCCLVVVELSHTANDNNDDNNNNNCTTGVGGSPRMGTTWVVVVVVVIVLLVSTKEFLYSE